MSKQVQVINDSLDYVPNLNALIKREKLEEIGENYRTVAIIGAQSSGKSTLLNAMFGTKFDTLNQETSGMQQTTKGVWVSTNDQRNIIVFDIEGTDSSERGNQRTQFEQTTSLFALALSNVLLINMWSKDIGRHNGSNYGLLRIIFEVNLRLFKERSK